MRRGILELKSITYVYYLSSVQIYLWPYQFSTAKTEFRLSGTYKKNQNDYFFF